MLIDARKLKSQELFLQLRDILGSKRGCNVQIEILINTLKDTKKVKAFVSMSGCNTNVEKKNDYYILHVSGTPCCA
jgi:hypothetical protein